MFGILALVLAYVLSQFFRSFLAVLTPALSVDLNMSPNLLSQSLGVWFMVFAAFQFVVGPLLDRYGPRLTSAGLLAFGGGCGSAVFALANEPWMVILAMALIGVGCSPILMAAMVIFRQSFSPARFAVLSSTFIAIGSAGNLLSTSPVAWASELWGWRGMMWALCALTIVVSALIVVFVSTPKISKEQQQGSYWQIISNRKLWPILPICIFSYAVMSNIRGLWAGPYLEQVHGLGTVEIGSITFLIALAMVAGALLHGPLDTVFNTRKYVVAAGTTLLLIALLVWIINPAFNIATVTTIMVAMGLFGTSYAVIMAHGLAFVPAHMTGRGATLLNFFVIGGSGLMQSLSGALFEFVHDPLNPTSGFSAVLWLYMVCLSVALLIYFWSQDVKPAEPVQSEI